jgi:hypothetical protein
VQRVVYERWKQTQCSADGRWETAVRCSEDRAAGEAGSLQIGTVSRQKTTLHCVEASLRRLASTRTLPGRPSGVLLQKAAAQARRGAGVAVERCRSHGAPSSWQNQCPAVAAGLPLELRAARGSPLTLSASTVPRPVETAGSGWARAEDKRRAPCRFKHGSVICVRERASHPCRGFRGKEGIRGLWLHLETHLRSCEEERNGRGTGLVKCLGLE